MTSPSVPGQSPHSHDVKALAADAPHRGAHRLAGFLYLFLMVTGILAQLVRGSVFASGDPVQTAVNVAASELSLRAATVLDLLNVAGAVMLAWALYLVLGSVSRPVALLGVLWQVVAAAGWAMLCILDFATFQLLSPMSSDSGAFDVHQVQVLGYSLARLYGQGYRAFLIFYMLAAIPFAWLWLESRYVPRPFAVLGMAASSLGVAAAVIAIAVPRLAGALTIQVYGAPIFLYEVGLGSWLLSKGIRLAGEPASATDRSS